MATWNLYDLFRRKQVAGSGQIDIAAVTIKCALVTTGYTPDQNLHDFWADVVASEVTGTNYTAGGNACAVPTVTMNGSGLVTVDAGDPATWAQHASGFNNAVRAIVYRSTGVDATSELIAYSGAFTAGGNVDGPFSIQFDAAGIFTSPR